MKKVHVVPHMHWDREWYFSTEESRILLVNNMSEIMDRLENDPDYLYYVMDGQTAILEDYFAVKPEARDRVKKLVQAGKLIIGPWYTQTDEMVVGAESIVRNLLYGLQDCEQFGEPMMIGYLPDSFGQSAQLPQILNGFDINRCIFWRGVSERKGTNKTEFYWTADDGSKVLVQLFPLGYAIGKYLPEDLDALKKRMDKYLPVLDKGATTEHIILPNGHDQMPIQQNIFTIMDKLKELYPDRDFFMSRYENIFEQLEQNKNLDTISGEFLDGKYMRVHRSIFSTRMDIKALNTKLENMMTNILEPLASIAYSLGFEYHHGLIELIWKEMMKNHAHDSIGCCCSDKVHAEVLNRFILCEEKAEQLIKFYMRKIVDNMDTQSADDRLTFFNLKPYVTEEVVTTSVISKLKGFKIVDENGVELEFDLLHKEEIDPGLIDRQIVHYGNYDPFMVYKIQFKVQVPAMGYKNYFIQQDEVALEITQASEVNEVDTPYYNITVNKNGTLNVTDKQLGKTFKNVLLIEDGADDGDEYDFSPLPNETLIYNNDVTAEVSITQNKYLAKIHVHYELAVPSDLDSRKAGKRDGKIEVCYEVKIPMNKAILDVEIEVENLAKDHRVRAIIPTDIAAKFSVSDNQFGHIKRDVYDTAMDVWEKEGWDERPDSIYPMLSYVGISDESHGVAVLTAGTREFEIVGYDYDSIAITLFRSVGFLGKEEMVRRPGRPSGIKLATPDSQMLGAVNLHFAIVTHKQCTIKANVAKMAKDYLTPIQVYNKIPYNAMKLNDETIDTPLNYSLLTVANPDTILSVLKKAQKEDALVVRAFNPTADAKTLEVDLSVPVTKVTETNLNENDKCTLDKPAVDINTNQVKTIKISI
ncbi:MAG: alpha-mannosidase [Epulopiscium sp. Nele67-Bin001]|nr:MAG: alpha-mannosidase [Epulopiscium sp. Nele67-Bin001]